MNKKVVIIGAGFVGASIAYALTIKSVANEVVLIDVDEERALGEVLDIQHGVGLMGNTIIRLGNYTDCTESDLVIITAGRNRKNGETRLDLAQDNLKISYAIVQELKKNKTNCPIMIISNPVDILTYFCDKWLGLGNGMVFGTGCLLDTSRLTREIANYVKLNIDMINCSIVGEHGESQFPLWSNLSVANIPIKEYCDITGLEWNKEIQKDIYNKVKNMGANIIMRKGKTHYGIATCVLAVADAILNKHYIIEPVSTPLQGEYGLNDVSLSIPSIIGPNGVIKRLEEKWSDEELEKLRLSASTVSSTIKQFNNLY